jgi:hypothetical protein
MAQASPQIQVIQTLDWHDKETPVFRVAQDDFPGVELEYGKTAVLGRPPDVFPDPFYLGPDASVEHCSVTIGRIQSRFGIELVAIVEDLGSTNGTEVIVAQNDFLEKSSEPPRWA